MSRNIHQDVEAAQAFPGVLDELLAERLILNVAGEGTALRPAFSMRAITSSASGLSDRR